MPGCSAVSGEDPGPLVASLRREPALTVAPPQGAPVGEVEVGADSGSAVAEQRYSGCRSTSEVIEHYAERLSELGWTRHDRLDQWQGKVNGREAELYLTFIEDSETCSVEIFTDYQTGIIGG